MHNRDRSIIVRITSGARKHSLSQTRIEQALGAHVEAITLMGHGTDPKILFIGPDGRGEELEIVAVVLPSELLVIHAMPTRYRKGRP